MFEPRVYRAALIVVIPALIVAAFSLREPAHGLTANLPPDAFLGARAFSQLQGLAGEFPDRRPGSPGDQAFARRVATELRTNGFRVDRRSFRAQTTDGRRRMVTVAGVRAGRSDRRIIVLAHRDALSRPATAELSGMATLLELARVSRVSTLRKTLVLVSTSGGSAGGSGAADFAGHIATDTAPAAGPVDGVIVLGDVAGRRRRQPVVIPWSQNRAIAPPLLSRTVTGALTQESGHSVREPRGLAQLARLAFPLTVGEQGPVNAAGLPAVMVQVSGERGPGSETAVSRNTLATFGRGVLRSVTALDRADEGAGAPRADMLLSRKLVPEWAVRLVVAALILPVLVAAIDAFARVRRRREPVARWVGWTLVNSSPFVFALLLAYFLALVGLIPASPSGPVPAGAIPLHGRGVVALCVLVPALALGWFGVRALLLSLIGLRRDPSAAGAAAATVLVLCLVVAAIWIVNPFAAALFVIALHVWLFVLEPALRPPRWLAALLLLVTLIPGILVVFYYADRLDLSLAEIPWTALLLVTGGHVGVIASLTWTLLLGLLASGLLVALAGREDQGVVEPRTRGPLTYAGPGSLGGTDSALRR